MIDPDGAVSVDVWDDLSARYALFSTVCLFMLLCEGL